MVEDKDLFMRIFLHILEGDVHKWFWALPPNSLHSWDNLERKFQAQWGEKKDFQYYLTELLTINKNVI